MIDYDTIKINGKKVKALKRKTTLYRPATAIPRTIKIIYELPIEVYNETPKIINIDNKKFYKTDINEINQTHFKLIEI